MTHTLSQLWLNPDIRYNELAPPGYKIMRNDSESRGGGVAIVRDYVECIRLQGIQNHESVWCNVRIGNAFVLLGAIYRAPNKSASYLQDIKSYLDQHKPRHGCIILSGDFNLPDIDWDSFTVGSQEGPECDALIDIAFAHDLKGPSNTFPDLIVLQFLLSGCVDWRLKRLVQQERQR